MSFQFHSEPSLIRTVCGAAALVVTLSIGLGIDALAGMSSAGTLAAAPPQPTATVVAQR